MQLFYQFRKFSIAPASKLWW